MCDEQTRPDERGRGLSSGTIEGKALAGPWRCGPCKDCATIFTCSRKEKGLRQLVQAMCKEITSRAQCRSAWLFVLVIKSLRQVLQICYSCLQLSQKAFFERNWQKRRKYHSIAFAFVPCDLFASCRGYWIQVAIIKDKIYNFTLFFIKMQFCNICAKFRKYWLQFYNIQ